MVSSSGKDRARERAAKARAAEEKAARQRRRARWGAGGGALAVVIAIVVVIVVHSSGSSTPSVTPSATPSGVTTGLSYEGMELENGPVLAPASTAATGQTIDTVQCESSEQLVYHIHAHLAVYVNGTLRPIPLGIGIVEPDISKTPQGNFASATKCYYWLHVHMQDGVIHIESPSKRIYTLGQFFDEWQQPLSPTQVATAKGAVTAYVDGQAYTGDLRTIPLNAHTDIQLDVGSPTVPAKTVDWSQSKL